MHGRLSSPVSCNIQRCAQRCACTVKDLLLPGPAVSSVVAACVRKSFTDDQFLIAYLLKECVMVRDGLAKLTDCFTAGDTSDIASYVSTC